MKIYHPSDKKFDIVKVKYFGEHLYTKREASISDVPRTFWYLTPDIPEARFKTCRYIYETEIKESDIYDLRKDNLELKNESQNIHNLLIHLKLFYQGAIYTLPEWDMVILFNDIVPIRIIDKEQNNG